jgi:hypothetical protein
VSAVLLAQPGSASITVATPQPGGGSSAAIAFAIAVPKPALNVITPDSVGPGSAFALLVLGSHFVAGSRVEWNGVARATTFVFGTTLRVDVTPSDVATVGDVAVRVTNPPPGGGTSGTATLRVRMAGPQLTSISPFIAVAGSGSFVLTARGVNFGPGMTVQWNGQARPTTYVSATTLTATIQAADVSAAGSASVAVRDPTTGVVTSAANFSIEPPPAPFISSLSPSSVLAGSSGFTLSVQGTNFSSGMVIQWNGQDRATTFGSATTLTTTVAAADIATAASITITVKNPANGQVSVGYLFTVSAAQPHLSAITPNSYPPTGTGLTLTVDGTDFVQGVVVRWNGQARATTYVTSRLLYAVVQSADMSAAGTAAVTVYNPATGQTTPALTFTLREPQMSSLVPQSVLAGRGGLPLTVQGQSFGVGLVVLWNGEPRNTTFVDGQLFAFLLEQDVRSPGTATVTVRNPATGYVTPGLVFTIKPPG